jgi:hypothetical protein
VRTISREDRATGTLRDFTPCAPYGAKIKSDLRGDAERPTETIGPRRIASR